MKYSETRGTGISFSVDVPVRTSNSYQIGRDAGRVYPTVVRKTTPADDFHDSAGGICLRTPICHRSSRVNRRWVLPKDVSSSYPLFPCCIDYRCCLHEYDARFCRVCIRRFVPAVLFPCKRRGKERPKEPND